MALVVGTNSWATVAEANTYLNDRIGATSWFSLNDSPANPGEDSKESFLISALFWIRGSAEVTIGLTVTVTNVKYAQIEAALFLLEHYLELNERRAAISTGVSEFQYSKRGEIFDPSQLRLPLNILGLLSDYMTDNVTVTLKGEFDV